MWDSIKKNISGWKKQRAVTAARNTGSDGNYWSAHMLEHDKKLKNFIPAFETLGNRYNELLHKTTFKSDAEHRFARLMILKQTELYHAIILASFFNFSHAVVPLMKNFCETVAFLKYVEMHPDYVQRFMQKAGSGVSVLQIKNEIPDEELKTYYSYLSELMHADPTSIMLAYYRRVNKKIITQRPLNMDEFREAYISSLISFMTESIRIIETISSRKGKTGNPDL